MGWFGWLGKDPAADKPASPGPQAMLADLDKRVPQYIDDADQGRVVYPACKRTVLNASDVRAIWATRPASRSCSTPSFANRPTKTP
jgi:hypothetical protein